MAHRYRTVDEVNANSGLTGNHPISVVPHSMGEAQSCRSANAPVADGQVLIYRRSISWDYQRNGT